MRPGPNQVTCGWTRDRLPLLAEPEPADCRPSPVERRLIAAHLRRCGGCRDHLKSLRGILAILELAAADSPADPRSPSLWPALEARIAAAAEARRAVPPPPRFRFAPGLAAAAALLLVLIAHPRLQAWRADSEARIAAADAPLAVAVEKSRAARAELLMALDPGDADETPDSAVGPESLAQNTAPPGPPPGRAADGTKDPAAAATAAVRRYDFDLERGVPMPRGAQTGAAY